MMILRLTLQLFTGFREIVAGFLMEMQKPKQPAIAPARRPFVDKPIETIQLTPDQVEAIAVAETVSAQMLSPDFAATPILVEPQPIVPTGLAAEVPEIPDVPTTSLIGEPVAAIEEPASESPLIVLADRKAVVHSHLAAAWQQGLRTYPQLIKYVELQTGKGCSKRMVSDWKKSQLLADTDAVAA